MKIVNVILTKGPEDYGCWLENFKGVYGVGDSPTEAVNDLKESIQLYAKHNPDAPNWLGKTSFRLMPRKK